MKKLCTFAAAIFLLIGLKVPAQSLVVSDGTALSFNSANKQYIDLSSTGLGTNYHFTTGLTFEGWINWGSFGSWSRFIEIGNSITFPTPGNNNILFANDGTTSKLIFQVYIGSTSSTLEMNVDTLKTGKWYHIAVTEDGSGNANIYIDGVLVASGPVSVPGNVDRSYAYIGKSLYSADQYFNGSMDDIRIWDVARTQTEIRQDMFNELTGRESGLIAYYNLNEGSGTIATNWQSFGGYDGTLVNNPTWVNSGAAVGVYGNYNVSTSADAVGASGAKMTVTITSSPSIDNNFLGVYSNGSVSEPPVTTDVFPTGITKRSDVIWGIFNFGSNTANITIDYSNMNYQNESELHVLKREDPSSSWTDVTSNFTQNTSTHTFSATGVSSFSQFTIGSGSNNTLPVELKSFTAVVANNVVNLNWNTATEVNNYGFEVQRSNTPLQFPSQEGKEQSGKSVWENVGFVKGAGTTNSTKTYSFTDDNPLRGKAEYRLKQENNDGTFKYSSIVTVNSVPDKFELSQNYPNPFNPTTRIQYAIPKSEHVTLKIYDELGNVVKTLVNGEKSAGEYNVEFNGSNLSSGIYFYKISAGNYSAVKKLLLLK